MTITIGTTFRHVYADSNALWRVTERVAPGIWEAEIDASNMDYAGQRDVFREEYIARSIAVQEGFNRTLSDSEAWWASLPLGTTVHYHSAFGQWLRGTVEIVKPGSNGAGQKGIRPTAMVGTWGPHDLPRRKPNGTVDYGYHAEGIREGRAWQPHCSNVYEAQPGKFADDPRSMEPLSLEPPAMTSAEEIDAQVFQRYESVMETLRGDGTPRDAAEAKLRLRLVYQDLRIALAADAIE